MYMGNGENYKNELLFTSQRSQETKRYIQNLCLSGLGLLHTYRERQMNGVGTDTCNKALLKEMHDLQEEDY
jgi:hypothetical protein